MARSVAYSEIIAAILDGVKNASKKHHKWSGGYWQYSARESFIESEIANSI